MENHSTIFYKWNEIKLKSWTWNLPGSDVFLLTTNSRKPANATIWAHPSLGTTESASKTMLAEETSSSFQSITIKSFQSVHQNVFEFLFYIQSGGVAAHAPSGRLAHQWTSSSWMGTRSRQTCSTLGQCNLALISENPKSTSTILPSSLHDIWVVF